MTLYARRAPWVAGLPREVEDLYGDSGLYWRIVAQAGAPEELGESLPHSMRGHVSRIGWARRLALTGRTKRCFLNKRNH